MKIDKGTEFHFKNFALLLVLAYGIESHWQFFIHSFLVGLWLRTMKMEIK